MCVCVCKKKVAGVGVGAVCVGVWGCGCRGVEWCKSGLEVFFVYVEGCVCVCVSGRIIGGVLWAVRGRGVCRS